MQTADPAEGDWVVGGSEAEAGKGQRGRGLLGSWPLELQEEEGPVLPLDFCRVRGGRQVWEVVLTAGEHKSGSHCVSGSHYCGLTGQTLETSGKNGAGG